MKKLEELLPIIKQKSVFHFEKEVEKFLNTVDGQYVPNEILAFLKKGMKELYKIQEKDPSEPPPEILQAWEIELDREHAQEEANLDSLERFEKEFKEAKKEFADSMQDKINSKIKEITNN
ncbi:MAG TPA: hypothetical protein VI977_04435 [archaeon]|nr:hypothetical protein [archaeon]